MGPTILVGHGLDAHRLAAGRSLVLGGVDVPAPRGADAHSDGDVVLHALSDALLATVAAGDIGLHFPDDDERWRGADSRTLVRRVRELVAREGVRSVVNVAVVIVLDAPKLSAQRGAIARSLASLLDLSPARVGVTLKTSEGLAPDHVQASVTVLVEHEGA